MQDYSPGKQRALRKAIGKCSKSQYQLLSSPQIGHPFLLPAKLLPVHERHNHLFSQIIMNDQEHSQITEQDCTPNNSEAYL